MISKVLKVRYLPTHIEGNGFFSFPDQLVVLFNTGTSDRSGGF